MTAVSKTKEKKSIVNSTHPYTEFFGFSEIYMSLKCIHTYMHTYVLTYKRIYIHTSTYIYSYKQADRQADR